MGERERHDQGCDGLDGSTWRLQVTVARAPVFSRDHVARTEKVTVMGVSGD